MRVAIPDRALLERILHDPAFSGAHAQASALHDLLDRLQALLGALLGSSGVIGAAKLTRTIFFLVLLGLVVWLARRALRRLRPSAPPTESGSLRPRLLASAADHLRRAEAARARGAHREAIRQSLLAMLASLEHSEVLVHTRSATNREIPRELRARGAPEDLAQACDDLVARFDPLWYGGQPVTAEQALAVERAAMRVARAARPRRAWEGTGGQVLEGTRA